MPMTQMPNATASTNHFNDAMSVRNRAGAIPRQIDNSRAIHRFGRYIENVAISASSLNFHHLRYFWVVAREGSVSRAAQRLRVTQPTVSGQLAALADQLGEPLFRRDGRKLVLTEVGEAVARIADEIFALGDRVVEVVRGNAPDRPLRL